MTDLAKENGGTLTEWNPMRAMREMLRWDPLGETAPMFGISTARSPEVRFMFNG